MTELFVSQVTHLEPRHKLKALSLALTLLSAAIVVPAHALEEMTDAGMSDATGEGLAIFATNFAFQMPSVAGDYSKGNMNYISPTTGQNLFGAGAYGGTTSSSSSTSIFVDSTTKTPGSPATNSTSNGDGANVWNGNTRCSYGLNTTCDIKFTNYNTAIARTATTTVASNAIIGAAGGYGSYIYLAPVGAVPANTNQTDIYVYGLSISQNDNSTTNADGSVVVPASGTGGATPHNTLFNQAGTGVDWGSVGDPFTLSVQSSAAVGLDGTAVATPVPYLSIAAPTGSSGSNMRLGAWLNVMQYDSTSGLNNNTELSVGKAGPALQIQMVWDGFGINGTQINLFPTPQSTTACISGVSGNCQLANTLGFNGVLRINSQPTGVLRLSVAEGSITYGAPTVSGPITSYENYNSGSGFLGSGNSTVDRIFTTTTTKNITATDNPVGQFDPYEGVYIQNLHANLVLGAFNFQPLVLSSTNGMISLELGRIPNNSAAYSKYYIDYGANGDGTGASTGLVASALGNCTATACPSTATHSSITIGDVYLNSTASPVTKTYYLSENDGTDGTNNQSKLAPTATCTANGASPNCFAVTETIYPGQSNALYKADGTLTSTSVNGITFKAPGSQGATVNLGTASISGMMINHMKMTLTGL